MNSKHRISVRSFDEFQRRRKWYETVFWFVRNVRKEKITKAAANAVTQIKFNKNKMNWDVLSQVAIEDIREKKNTDIVNRMVVKREFPSDAWIKKKSSEKLCASRVLSFSVLELQVIESVPDKNGEMSGRERDKGKANSRKNGSIINDRRRSHSTFFEVLHFFSMRFSCYTNFA